MSRILKFSQTLVLTQYTLNSYISIPYLRTILNILSISSAFSTSVIYGGCTILLFWEYIQNILVKCSPYSSTPTYSNLQFIKYRS